MAADTILIKRYPNRRFYARHISAYVSLQEIEQMVREGHNVEIRDSQSGEDITRQVLTQILLDQQPDKIRLFPTDLLHSMLRANDMMSDFLRDYLRHSLTYLDYLQKHSPLGGDLPRPTHWAKAWLDGFLPGAGRREESEAPQDHGEPAEQEDSAALARRVRELEERIRQLEADAPRADDARSE